VQLVDRIEKRRFVGREFLLWLWFESELFDATLRTEAHGSFGLWLEKRMTLSAEKCSTRIVGPSPGFGREAKEALLAGKLPESAGIRIALRETETGFLLKAERLSISGLKLATVLDRKSEREPDLVRELKGARGGKKGKKGKQVDSDDDAHELFYERMQLTAEIEEIVEALYSDFRALRLSLRWNDHVVPFLRAWARGDEVDADAYAAMRWPQRQPEPAEKPAGRRASSAGTTAAPQPAV
jgi:hypothetical protein